MESEMMLHSFSAQVSHYSQLIQSNPDWQYAGVYADRGISGTGTKKRAEFNRMMADCEAGKIDIILVKSVSRFARNTLDLLQTVRHLRELGISVRFEEQNIDSLTEEGELMLTLMASVAQAESESISENAKWAIHKAFQQGIGNTRNRVLGYQWVNGKLTVVPEEAEVVKRIFNNFLAGSSHTKTAEELLGEGVTTINGKPLSVSAVSFILRNITYTGNTLLQKTFVSGPISKKKVMNTGELPQYLVQDDHEAIIDMDTFERVQVQLARNKEMGRFPYNHTGEKYPFTRKVVCGCCGRHYTRQLWNTSAVGRKRPTWVCTGKKTDKFRRCNAKNIPESKLMEGENDMPVVTTIPATKPRYAAQKVKQNKRRVAAYARVSTDHEEQLNSYDAQIRYYTDYIQGRQDWEFVGMFSDEGITGTSIKKRDGFNDMVSTALRGKIDLIITKSVSRFARNTVDSLSTIRKLKDHGVEVYFEKENIWTFDSKGELLITIMSSLAQEESRSISENTLWGIRRSFQNGNEYVPYKHFLGYDRGENGGLVVNQDEAKIVRFIYNHFLNGGTYNGIANELTQLGVKTPYGNEKWIGPTVRNILTNEKYKGDALLQKKYTSDYLTKKMLVNHGEVPQYYVSECHEAIIDPQVFDLVQGEVLRRNGMSGRHSNTHIFSTKIQCADCGAWFGPVVYHSNTSKRRIVWRCSDKYNKAHEKCHTPALDIEDVKKAFVDSLNKKLAHRDEVLENLKEIRNLISGGEKTLQQQTALWEEGRLLEEQMQALIMRNARIAMDQEQYQKEFDELVARHSSVTQEYEEQAIAAEQDVGRVAQIDYFIRNLEELHAPITEFDEQLWISMVDHVVVHSKEDIRVVYRDGIEE